MPNRHSLSRRRLIASTAGLALAAAVRPVAAALTPTPRQTAGPFYPETFPLDSDSDLVTVEGRATDAAGQILYLSGRLLDAGGRPAADARIEIWQADDQGRYHHPRDAGTADPNFQGYGRTVTDGNGVYRFRTIKPAAYATRTPHIHFALSGPGFERMTTQMYFADEPRNATDGILNAIRDPQARASVIVAPTPASEIADGALKATFDIILGHNAVVPA